MKRFAVWLLLLMMAVGIVMAFPLIGRANGDYELRIEGSSQRLEKLCEDLDGEFVDKSSSRRSRRKKVYCTQ